MTGPLIDLSGAEPLEPERLQAYFALTEAASLLQHRVERHLRGEGDLSGVQFQILMRLASGDGRATMTELADGLVHSRSGLTYQAGLLEKAGLVTRAPSEQDERAVVVTITDEGVAVISRVLPGHIDVVRRSLLDQLSDDDVRRLAEMMARVRDHMRAEPPRSAAARRSPSRAPVSGEAGGPAQA
ncbi:MarR family winged helix-turn-helix transcriptional regulator [Occultella gossypii]|uniref:MarR family transcriptional regulator n=1 Tax=Occultella gossypii TaxID=2800820 RepID=A0ABS7S8K9_9MICO|nr:MarR family transcriptional regulator [Occultella gossypii]MBZ2196679.1 MarR family transcriptional regulator [Occultella gossypii]